MYLSMLESTCGIMAGYLHHSGNFLHLSAGKKINPVLQPSLPPAEVRSCRDYSCNSNEDYGIILDYGEQPSEHADVGGHGPASVSNMKQSGMIMSGQ